MEEFGFTTEDEDDFFNPKRSIQEMKSLHEIGTFMENSDETSISDVDIESVSVELPESEDEGEIEIPSDETRPQLNDVIQNDNQYEVNLPQIEYPEGQMNPTPNETEYQEGQLNPLPGSIDYPQGETNPLPESVEYEEGSINALPESVEYQEGETNPLPESVEYQEGSINALPESVEYEEGSLNPLPEKIEVSRNDSIGYTEPTSPFEDMPENQGLSVEVSKQLNANREYTFRLQNTTYTPEQPVQPSAMETMMRSERTNQEQDFTLPTSISSTSKSARKFDRKSASPDWRTRHG